MPSLLLPTCRCCWPRTSLTQRNPRGPFLTLLGKHLRIFVSRCGRAGEAPVIFFPPSLQQKAESGCALWHGACCLGGAARALSASHAKPVAPAVIKGA